MPLGFKILNQEHYETPLPNGATGDEWRIDFETPSGVRSFIRLPGSQYNADAIARLITERVAQIENVHALGSTGEGG